MQQITSILVELEYIPALLLKATMLLAAAWCAHFILQRHNPRWRVLLWRGVFVALIALPIAQSFAPRLDLAVEVATEMPPPAGIQETPSQPTQAPTIEVSERPAQAAEPAPAVVGTSPKSPFQERSSVPLGPILAGLWIVGCSLLVLRFLAALARLKKQIAQTKQAPHEIGTLATAVASDLGLSTQPGVRTTTTNGSPFLTGLLRPVIVLPERCLQGENAARMPAILAHELAHAKSFDVIWMNGARLLTAILWFHPLMWRVRVAHNAACEEVCDGVAADYIGSTKRYSKTLAQEALAVQGVSQLQAGVPMIRRAEIINRLRKIERGIRTNPIARKWVATCAVVGAGIFITLASLRLVAAQTEVVETKYPHLIPFETYETSWSAFEPGDTIAIFEVRGTKPRIEKGGKYYVMGKYVLTSHESALLHVYATNGEVESKQGPPVPKGAGEFVREFILTKDGMTHVSFYPEGGGDGFGDRYFRRDEGEPVQQDSSSSIQPELRAHLSADEIEQIQAGLEHERLAKLAAVRSRFADRLRELDSTQAVKWTRAANTARLQSDNHWKHATQVWQGLETNGSAAAKSFGIGRKYMYDANALKDEGRCNEAISMLDVGRWESNPIWDEASELIVKYKQAARIPLTVSEKRIAIEAEQQRRRFAASQALGDSVYVLTDGKWRRAALDDEPATDLSLEDPEYYRALYNHPELEELLTKGSAVIVRVDGSSYRFPPLPEGN